MGNAHRTLTIIVMKNFTIVYLLVLSSTILLAQTDGYYKLNNFGNASESLITLSVLDNENILLTSAAQFDINKPYNFQQLNRKFYLVSNEIIWKKFYTHTNNFGISPKRLLKNSTGNFIIVGSTRHHNSSQLDLDRGNSFTCEMDTDGNVLWYSVIGEEKERDWGVAITQIEDGGYAIAGWKYRNENSIIQNAVLRKINAVGDSIWSIYFEDIGDFRDFEGKAIINGDFNSIFFIYQKDSESNAKQQFSIVHVDGHTGDIFWEKEYDMGVTNDVFNVVRNNKGNLVIGGSIRFENQGGCITPCIWEIDYSGNIIQQRDFMDELGCMYGAHLTPTNDGGYVVSYQDNHYPRLVKLDKDYNIEINNLFPIEPAMRTKGAVQMPDGRYVMAGYEGSTKEYTVWIIVTDTKGDLISAINTLELNTAISLYPNPTSNYLYIDLGDETIDLGELTYNIIDLQGRIVRTGYYSNKIDITQLSTSNYFLNLYLKGHQISSNQWMKR